MSQVEQILAEIHTLPTEQQQELFKRLIDFESYSKQIVVKKQKQALRQIIGIANGEVEHPDHDQVLADAELQANS